MKKQLEELKEQLMNLKEKIEIIEAKIDASESEFVMIDKTDFQYLDFKFERGYAFIKYKECLFNVSDPSETLKQFKEGILDFMVIKKLTNISFWCNGMFKLTHSLLGPIDAAKYKYYV